MRSWLSLPITLLLLTHTKAQAEVFTGEYQGCRVTLTTPPNQQIPMVESIETIRKALKIDEIGYVSITIENDGSSKVVMPNVTMVDADGTQIKGESRVRRLTGDWNTDGLSKELTTLYGNVIHDYVENSSAMPGAKISLAIMLDHPVKPGLKRVFAEFGSKLNPVVVELHAEEAP